MKMQLLLAAAGTALLLAAAPVMAGTCTDQISSLEKILSSKDAGPGPTNGSQASGQNSSASSSEQLASADQSAAEGGSTPKAGQVPDTAGTPLMNQAQGKATSPQDVLKQNEGQPTVGDTAQAQSLGQSTQVAGSSPMEASNLLKQAKDLDKAGKENECMAIIQKAKQQIGAQ
jgi:hypothetical protein